MDAKIFWRACVRGLLLCAALASCSPQGAPARRGESSAPPLLQEEYRLGTGDQLRIVVFGQSDLTGQYVVGVNGAIAFPLIGDINARGETVPEFSASLREALQHGFVRDPNVSVEVTNYRPFFILGEVGDPGTYPFSGGLTVMNAVATAGGFSYRANSRRVFIKHAEEESEREYELNSMTPVRPGDTVRIPERRF
ncbi:MAG: polysaccharide biosynthesis/export family protein [Terricaulis sp.]